MRVIYRKIRHARYLYIKRNVEKSLGARYTLGVRYLSKNTVLIAHPQQQWWRERASILSYTCTACLVSSALIQPTDGKRPSKYTITKHHVQSIFRCIIPIMSYLQLNSGFLSLIIITQSSRQTFPGHTGENYLYYYITPESENWSVFHS